MLHFCDIDATMTASLPRHLLRIADDSHTLPILLELDGKSICELLDAIEADLVCYTAETSNLKRSLQKKEPLIET